MKNVKLLITLLFVFAGTGVAEDPVYFADKKLKKAVVYWLKAKSRLKTANPTPHDMLQLKKIHFTGSSIRDYEGLQYAKNITFVRINDFNTEAISALSSLPKLESLYLNDAHVLLLSSLISKAESILR